MIANGNGEAEFKLHLATAFLVIEKLSVHALREVKKEVKKGVKKSLSEVMTLMKHNPHITYEELMVELNIKQTALYNRIKELKSLGLIKRVDGRYGGKWEIIESPKS